MTRDPDTLPTSNDPSGKCPRCGRVAQFYVIRQEPLARFGKSEDTRVTEQVTVIECHGCDGKSVVIEAAPKKYADLVGVLWWPTEHLGDLEQAAGVPQDIIESYSEGVRCVGVQAPNAASAMFRTVIAKIVQNKGSEAAKKANTLHLAIKQMVTDRALFDDFGDWADHVRTTGNAGAHGEKFDPVDMEQATELQKFIRELINFLYVQPARLANARQPTKQAAATPPNGAATPPPSATSAAPTPAGQQ